MTSLLFSYFLWILGWNCTIIYLIVKEAGKLAVIREREGDQHDVVISNFILKRQLSEPPLQPGIGR